MVRVGLIGYGYWGPNLVRNFAEGPGSEVAAVSDLRPDRLAKVKSRYPTVHTTTDYHELLDDSSIDAIAIVTPVSTHFDLARQALEAGKHVFVEKPLAEITAQASWLVEEARRRKKVLMVDHTFIYTSAVQKIRELVAGNHLGKIYYYDSVRVNLGLFQHDVNVLWDLAVHDLAIIDYVFDGLAPIALSATGMSHVPGEPENIAYLTLFFPENLIAHVHVNWLAPVKIRRTLLGGSKKMIVYDDVEPSEKVKVYDKGISLGVKGGVSENPESVYRMLIHYRAGDMWAPQLEMTEALQAEVAHFIQCVEKGRQPISDGEAGLRVVRILEAAADSLSRRGSLVTLEARRMAA
jgi:predicted dehydrogenase